MSLAKTFLDSYFKRSIYYKELGDKTFEQLNDADFHFQPNAESNSIAIIIQHVAGNMLSRWTDFLTSDGEKAWRERDAEFEKVITTRAELLVQWNKGWECLFFALNSIRDDDWRKDVYIRNERHSVVDAINRQLSHYPYHVGQIVFIGKMIAGAGWHSLSIPKGKSEPFNSKKFKQL